MSKTWSRATPLEKTNKKNRKQKKNKPQDSSHSTHSSHSTNLKNSHPHNPYPQSSRTSHSYNASYNNNTYNTYNAYNTQQYRPEIIVPLDPNIDPESDVKDNKWKSIVLNEIDNDLKSEEGINENDPKYWNGHQWIGPRMVRYVVSDRITYKNIQNKENTLTMRKKTEYSRDGIHWYKSWKDTFTPRQLHLQKKDLWSRPMEGYIDTSMRQINESRIASERYLDERGDYDDYAIVEKWHDNYDRFEEELTRPENSNKNDNSSDED